MTGAEHYTQAERLLDGPAEDLAAAQVHATLALAAATAWSDGGQARTRGGYGRPAEPTAAAS